MFSNQIVPYNNPSLVATPFIDQVSQGTAHMQAICAHNDAIKKFQALTKDCLDQNQITHSIQRSRTTAYHANTATSKRSLRH